MIPWFFPLRDFSGLFYPNLCIACGFRHPPRNNLLCMRCRVRLPRADHLSAEENELSERFWGRVPIYSAAAMFRFTKGGKVQRLLHKLKYQGRKEVGLLLGEWFGRDLRVSPYFKDVQVVVPVPLHPRKEHLRGYNQSDLFAQGIANSMEIPWVKNGLQRTIDTETQTRKGRLERFGNVETVFEVKQLAPLTGKHLLLVDDVVTTGATLEACTRSLLNVSGTKVSIGAIAMAT
jgi:ComF family protein